VRSEEGAYLIDGPVLVAEALAAGVGLTALYVEPDALADPVVWAARDAGVPVREVTTGALRKVLDLGAPQALVAVASMGVAPLDDVVARAASASRPLVVLVELADPGNAGTLVRVAEASGCAGLVTTARTVDLFNPKTVRASAGALFRLPVAESVELDDLFVACDRHGVPTWSTVARDGEELGTVALVGAGALLLGSEAHGLHPDVVARTTRSLTIPMDGAVESLNAAIAGAVVLFDAVRQRRAAHAEPAS
jgi:TrmH family RNA methyltransferase